MVSVYCCGCTGCSSLHISSVCYDVRVVYQQLRAPSLSLCLCLPSLIVVGWPPSPLFSRHICTHQTVYAHTCTRALLIAHPEREGGLLLPSTERLLHCVYTYPSRVWHPKSREERIFRFYWELSSLRILLCLSDSPTVCIWTTVVRNNYIYVSISLYLSAGLCPFVYHTPPVSLAWWGSWHNALWGCCYITDTTRHPWLGEWFWVKRRCVQSLGIWMQKVMVKCYHSAYLRLLINACFVPYLF